MSRLNPLPCRDNTFTTTPLPRDLAHPQSAIWQIGHLAEIDLDPLHLPRSTTETVVRRPASTGSGLGDHWLTLDGLAYYEDWAVTFVRPLRLVLADAWEAVPQRAQPL